MNIFDPDNTHDRLFAQRLNQTCISLIAGKLGNHSPFEAGRAFPVMLVERSAPGNPQGVDQWASDWTEIYFDILLKPLSRTFILTDGYLNGEAYGFEPEYQADLDQETMDSVWGTRAWPEEIKITVPEGKTAQVSWFEKAHPEVKSAPFCDKVANRISVWMRRTILLTAPKKEALEWIMPPNNADYLLHNSLLIVGDGSLETTPTAGADLVRAENLAMVCYLCLNGLGLPAQCRVLTGLTVEQTATTIAHRRIQSYNGVANVIPSGFIRVSRSVNYINPIFNNVPDTYGNATLTLAKINEKPLGAGLVITATPDYINISYNYPDRIASHLYENQTIKGWIPLLDSLSAMTLSYPKDVLLKTAEGEVSARRSSFFYSIFCIPYFQSFGNNIKLSLYTPQIENISALERDLEQYPYSQLKTEYAVTGGQGGSTEELVYFPVPDEWRWVRQTFYFDVFSTTSGITQFSLPPSHDYGLFSSGEIVWLKNGISYDISHSSQVSEIDPESLAASGSITQSGTVNNDIQALVFNIDATDSADFTVNYMQTVENTSVIQDLSAPSNTFSGPTVSYPIWVVNGTLTYSSVATVTLNRTFRTTPLSDVIKEAS